MRVLFFEPVHTGHHYAYLARMLPGFVDLPVELVLATSREGVESEEFARSLKPFAERLEIVTCCTRPPRGKPLANSWHRLTDLRRAIAELEPDHVAVLYADGIWQMAAILDLIGQRPWARELTVESWHFRGAFGEARGRSPQGMCERSLFRRLLRSQLFARLHMHHEILYEFARTAQDRSTDVGACSTSRAAHGSAASEVVLTADPLVLFDPVDRAEARRRLGLPLNGRIISLSGMISVWKGGLLLLAAFQRRLEAGGPAEERLLLAGPHDERIQARLRESPFDRWVHEGRVLSVDRFLSEQEMFLAAAASDVVTAPYPKHPGRSSVMLWASAAGRPVLGIDRGCIAYVIDMERLGWTCNVHDATAFADAIGTVLARPWSESDASRVRKYAEFHRVENYQHISADLVRRRCHLRHPQTVEQS